MERGLRLDGDLERLWWKLFIHVNSDLSEISQEQLWLLDTSASGQMGKTKEAKVKKQRSFTSRSSSSSRPGLEQTVSQVDPPGSTSADGHDDDAASVLSRSSSGGERVRRNTQFPCSRRSHGTPGPKSPARR